MGIPLIMSIFLFLVCLGGGILIGWMIARFTRPTPPTPNAQARIQEEISGPQQNDHPGEGEVLRAWRDETGRMQLEIDGRRLDMREELDSHQKEVLLQLANDLRPWLETIRSSEVTVQVTEPPRPTGTDVRNIVPVKPPVQVQAGNVVGGEKPQVSLKSIIEQIDDVLQVRLAGSIFSAEQIHLVEGKAGEVWVQIGAVKHLGVEAVPDQQIQALIRQAISDWENSTR